MDEKIVDEILDELFSSFEKSETNSAAILLLLKERGIASDEKLAPFLEQASRMSEVRWRAARVRMSALLKSAMKTPEPGREKNFRESRPREKTGGSKRTGRNRISRKKSGTKRTETKKKEPEKNPKPKADAEPDKESEKAAKPKSEDSKTPESNKPAAGETGPSGKNAAEQEKDAKAVPQKSTKPADSPEKAEKK